MQNFRIITHSLRCGTADVLIVHLLRYLGHQPRVSSKYMSQSRSDLFSRVRSDLSCAPSLLLPVLSSAPVLSSRAHPILWLPIYPPVPGLFRPLAPIPRARWSVLLHPVSLSLELLPILSYPSAPVHSSRAHPASRAFLSFCAHPILSRLVCPPMPGLLSCNLVLGLFSREWSVLLPVLSHP